MNKFLRVLFILVIVAMLGASILQIFLPSYMGEHSGYGVSAGWQREIGIWNLAVLIPIIHQVFADNEAAVADFKSGKRNADKAFTGFLMKATKGQANPQVALKLLAQELAKLKENE